MYRGSVKSSRKHAAPAIEKPKSHKFPMDAWQLCKLMLYLNDCIELASLKPLGWMNSLQPRLIYAEMSLLDSSTLAEQGNSPHGESHAICKSIHTVTQGYCSHAVLALGLIGKKMAITGPVLKDRSCATGQ
eukprot:Gb_11878 [translate_table: standard]